MCTFSVHFQENVHIFLHFQENARIFLHFHGNARIFRKMRAEIAKNKFSEIALASSKGISSKDPIRTLKVSNGLPAKAYNSQNTAQW